jgi:acetamidase/formamidase
MVDLLIEHWKFTPIAAYMLCSVAMDLRLAQVVNLPMTTVAATIPKSILPTRRLFPSA